LEQVVAADVEGDDLRAGHLRAHRGVVAQCVEQIGARPAGHAAVDERDGVARVRLDVIAVARDVAALRVARAGGERVAERGVLPVRRPLRPRLL
jgi:hypothetical protein